MEQLIASIRIMARLCTDPRLTDEEKSAIAFVAGYATGYSDKVAKAFDEELSKS